MPVPLDHPRPLHLARGQRSHQELFESIALAHRQHQTEISMPEQLCRYVDVEKATLIPTKRRIWALHLYLIGQHRLADELAMRKQFYNELAIQSAPQPISGLGQS